MSNSEKPKCKYYSYETIPAKCFFDIRESKNYMLMRPKNGVTTAELEALFQTIYDEYFVKIKNTSAKRYLELRNEIAVNVFKTEIVKKLLEFIFNIPANMWDDPRITEMRNNQITNLNTLLDTPIDLNNDILEEVERVLNVELGILQNDYTFLNAEIEDLTKQSTTTVFEYYDQIAALSDFYGRTLDEKMMLPMYVSLENRAIEKSRNTKKAA